MVDTPVFPRPQSGSGWRLSRRLPDLLPRYLQWHRIEGHTDRTIEDYRKDLGAFLKWLAERGHSLDAGDLSPFDVMEHLGWMRDQGRAPRTVRSRYAAIKAWCNWMAAWEVIPESPTVRIRTPKVPRQRKPFLTPDQFRALLDLCPPASYLGARRQAMFWVLATTGVRRMELARLRLDDLDWDKGVIRVRMGKGQKDRVVTFHRDAQRAVLRYLQHRGSGDAWPDLWLSEERRPMQLSACYLDLARVYKEAGMGDIKDKLHIFRRTWGAQASLQGMPRQYILERGGWESGAMLDHYTAALREEIEAANEAFGDFNPMA